MIRVQPVKEREMGKEDENKRLLEEQQIDPISIHTTREFIKQQVSNVLSRNPLLVFRDGRITISNDTTKFINPEEPYKNSFFGAQELLPPNKWKDFIIPDTNNPPQKSIMIVTPIRSGSTALLALMAGLVGRLNNLQAYEELRDLSREELRNRLAKFPFSTGGMLHFQPAKGIIRHQIPWRPQGPWTVAKFTPGGPSHPYEVIINPWELTEEFLLPQNTHSIVVLRNPYDRWGSTFKVVGNDVKLAPPSIQVLGDAALYLNILWAMEKGHDIVIINYHDLTDSAKASSVLETIYRRWGIPTSIIEAMKKELGNLVTMDPVFLPYINWAEGAPDRNLEYFEKVCLDAMTRRKTYSPPPAKGRLELRNYLEQEINNGNLTHEQIGKILDLLDISEKMQEKFLKRFGTTIS